MVLPGAGLAGAGAPPQMGGHGAQPPPRPPKSRELAAVHATRVQALAQRQVDPASCGPVPEDDGLGPTPEIEPGLAPDRADLSQLLACALLRAPAGRDARVHED